MATYYIPTDFIGGTIAVNEGDVFIFESGANTDVKFETLVPDTNFSIEFNESNANAFRVEITQRLHPEITIADNVDIGSVHLKATSAESTNVMIGDNVTLERFEGSKESDTVEIGNNFTTFVDFDTDGGNDTITIGQNATAPKFDAGGDIDTVNTADLTVDINNAEAVNFVCFAPGTLIDTPSGARSVRALRVGDLVQTLDAGPRPVRWVRSNHHPLDGVAADNRPVLIQAGALGDGLPKQDLIVSPQHRIFVGGYGILDRFFTKEYLVPAKALTDLPRIRFMRGMSDITWVHFALDGHHIVRANGLLSETLYLGPMVLSGLTSDELQSLQQIFGPMPSNGSTLNGSPARPFLTTGATRRHLSQPWGATSLKCPALLQIPPPHRS